MTLKGQLLLGVLIHPQREVKMIFNILLSAFAVQILLVQSVTALGEDCGDVFQSQLQQLLATKYLCNSAAFRDCCQVIIYYTSDVHQVHFNTLITDKTVSS